MNFSIYFFSPDEYWVYAQMKGFKGRMKAMSMILHTASAVFNIKLKKRSWSACCLCSVILSAWLVISLLNWFPIILCMLNICTKRKLPFESEVERLPNRAGSCVYISHGLSPSLDSSPVPHKTSGRRRDEYNNKSSTRNSTDFL